MSEPNYAGNIIVILANLPDFLRTPILKKRMMEFFSMSESEKDEMINNALDAGPTIPFPNFAKLFKTWLEVLCTSIFEIFSGLDSSNIQILSNTIRKIIENLDQNSKKKILLLCPDNARKLIGF